MGNLVVGEDLVIPVVTSKPDDGADGVAIPAGIDRAIVTVAVTGSGGAKLALYGLIGEWARCVDGANILGQLGEGGTLSAAESYHFEITLLSAMTRVTFLKEGGSGSPTFTVTLRPLFLVNQ